MTSERRQIKITLSPRVLSNAPDILRRVADDFKSEDLDIEVVEPTEQPATPGAVEPTVADEALKIADFVLDKVNQKYANNTLDPKSPSEVKANIKSWRELLNGAGIKFGIEVIFDKIISYGPQTVDAIDKTIGRLF